MATKPKTKSAAERTADACERIAQATERTAAAAERAAAAAEKAVAAAAPGSPEAGKAQLHLVLDTSSLSAAETAKLKQFQKEFKKRIQHVAEAAKL